MPGAAIWHMAWSDKDDAIDWQAYFHLRNRLVVAAMHMDGDAKALVLDTVKATVKHLLCLEYSTVAIQNKAIDDFLAGPGAAVRPAAHAPSARCTRCGRTSPTQWCCRRRQSCRWHREPRSARSESPKARPRRSSVSPRVCCTISVRRTPSTTSRPQLNVPTLDARWFLLSQVDGVTVTTADGRGVVYRKRDRAQAQALLSEALRLRRELARRFPEMKKRYRDAVPALTSKEEWERVFGAGN